MIRLAAAYRLGPFGYFIQTRTFQIGETFPEHNHEFCEFFLVVEGAVKQVFNGVECILPEGSLQLLFANDKHQLTSYGNQPATIYNIHVGNLRFQKDLASLSDSLPIPFADCIQRIAPLPQTAYHSLKYKMEELIDYDRHRPLAGSLFRLLTEEVLWLLASRTHDLENGGILPDWLRETYLQMKSPENFRSGFSRMVEISGRSPEHLCRMFRLHYGITPREFILEQRLCNAARRLELGASVTEAATLAGFRNLSYFRTAFRARFAMLPLQYRREMNRQ